MNRERNYLNKKKLMKWLKQDKKLSIDIVNAHWKKINKQVTIGKITLSVIPKSEVNLLP